MSPGQTTPKSSSALQPSMDAASVSPRIAYSPSAKCGEMRRDVDSLPGCQRTVAFTKTLWMVKWFRNGSQHRECRVSPSNAARGSMEKCLCAALPPVSRGCLSGCPSWSPVAGSDRSANRVYKNRRAVLVSCTHSICISPSLLPTYPYVCSEARLRRAVRMPPSFFFRPVRGGL